LVNESTLFGKRNNFIEAFKRCHKRNFSNRLKIGWQKYGELNENALTKVEITFFEF
jgi:hypothetical protein